MRLIDAEELKSIKSIQSADFNSIESIREWIDKASTIIEFHEPIIEVRVKGDEFEKVVRCKDCIYSKDTGDYQDSYFCESMTHASDYLVHSYDFCSYGERADT